MKHFNKLFTGLAIVLSVYSLILGGYDMGKHNYGDMVPNLVIGLFWFGFLFVLQMERLTDERLKSSKRELDALVKIAEEVKRTADKAKELQEQSATHNREILMAVLKDMGYEENRPPESEFAKVEAAFHDQADNYVKLGDDGNGGLRATFSEQPIEATQMGLESAENANPARVQIPVKDGNTAAQKPLTKSQQRRINAKKGLGPLTDEEVRQARNEKRRATRAARKAAAEGSTTTTTTQPGQTKLV